MQTQHVFTSVCHAASRLTCSYAFIGLGLHAFIGLGLHLDPNELNSDSGEGVAWTCSLP